MTRMTGPDYAVTCNLINTHTHIDTHTSMRVPYNDYDGRARMRSYVQFNKHTYTHTHTHTHIRRINASGIE